MASAEREPITGVRGRSPQEGIWAESLVGAKGQSPLKLKTFFVHFHKKEGPKVKDLNEMI